MKTAIIGIQARLGSTRFPGKILKKIGDLTILERIYKTCQAVANKKIEGLEVRACVLIPKNDLELAKYCEENKIEFYAPDVDENNLVARYNAAIEHYNSDYLVRITSDCPFINGNMIYTMLKTMHENDISYASNVTIRSCLDGMDVQMINRKCWNWYLTIAKELEHVFMDIEANYLVRREMENLGMKGHVVIMSDKVIPNPFINENKMSVDTPEDYERMCKIYEEAKNAQNNDLQGKS